MTRYLTPELRFVTYDVVAKLAQGSGLRAEAVLERLTLLGTQLGRLDRVCVFCNDTTIHRYVSSLRIEPF